LELGEHFSHFEIESMSIQIIDCVEQGEDEALSILEGYWQNFLASFQANDASINIKNKWIHSLYWSTAHILTSKFGGFLLSVED
jgi:hypothetical protein